MKCLGGKKNRKKETPTIKEQMSAGFHCQQKDESWSGSGVMSELSWTIMAREHLGKIISNTEYLLGVCYAINITFCFFKSLSNTKHIHRI